jgi:carbamoyl-phosphate synthase large subunit
MKRILVTGIGGAPGFDLARSLMRLGCHIIGTDVSPLAPGLLLPGITPRTMTSAGHPGYGAGLLELCRELRPDAIVSAVEQELAQLVAMQEPLAALGVTTWLPAIHAVGACADKAQFHAVLTEHRIPTPRTFLPDQIDEIPDGSPLVVKPRRGQGAKNVHLCRTRAQAKILCELVPEPIVQEKAEGREFTADCLVDRDGRASVILRHRLVVKAGLSMVSSTFHDEAVTDRVKQTLTAVGAAGACCAQGFASHDGERILMTEVNARVAGGFPLSEAAGADLVGQMLNGLFGRPVDHDRLRYKPGICLAKYIETLATTERTGQ